MWGPLYLDCDKRPIHVGDTVRVIHGAGTGDLGKVIFLSNMEGVKLTVRHGYKAWYWKHPCNLRTAFDPDLAVDEGL